MIAPCLNRALTLETRVRLPDGAGGFSDSWQALGQLWAEMRAGAGRNAAGEEVSLSSTLHRVILRAAPPGATARPVPGQRLTSGTRHFAILSVTEADPAGRYLLCITKEEFPT